MTTKDFISKWHSVGWGSWWLKDAGRCYWAAAYEMPRDKLLEMSQDFMALSNLDVYRGTPSCEKAMYVSHVKQAELNRDPAWESMMYHEDLKDT